MHTPPKECNAQRFFITGGLGFIGMSLVNLLLEIDEHIKITVFDAGIHAGRERMISDLNRVRLIKGDIRNIGELSSAVSDCSPDAVVHLAALHYIPYCIEHPNETNAVNIGGTKNLLECVRSVSSCKYFSMASSAAVYKDKEEKLSETDELSSIDIYGETKIQCERLIEADIRSPINYRVLRFFNAYGLDDPIPHVIPEIIRQLREGGTLKLGLTESYRDFIHTSDIARAVLASLSPDLGKRCTLNIGTGNPVSVQEIIRICDRLIKKRAPHFILNATTMDALKIRPTDRKMLCADIQKITALTSWRPSVSLEDGLDKLLEATGVYDTVPLSAP